VPLRGYKQTAASRRTPKVAMNTIPRSSAPDASTTAAAVLARLPALAALLLLALGAACAADLSPAAPASPAATRTDETLAAIHALVGDAACDSDAVCRSMAIGAKACGGPEGYFAWSTQRSDATRLAAAVASYNQGRVTDNMRDNRVSNCAMVMDPGVACLPTGTAGGPARQCQLQPRRPGLASPAR
jgi:hypothetical protein